MRTMKRGVGSQSIQRCGYDCRGFFVRAALTHGIVVRVQDKPRSRNKPRALIGFEWCRMFGVVEEAANECSHRIGGPLRFILWRGHLLASDPVTALF